MMAPDWLDAASRARFTELAPAIAAVAQRLPRDWPKQQRPAPLAGWDDHQHKGEPNDA